MKLTWLLPQRLGVENIDIQAIRELFSTTVWPEFGFVANLVANGQGEFWGSTGSSRDISNEVDLAALVGLRRSADGVLVTATTARKEKYRGSRNVSLAIVSRNGEFGDIPAVGPKEAGLKPVVLVTRFRHWLPNRLRFARHGITVIPQISFSAQFLATTLSSLGWNRVLVEAGPTYTSHLVRVGLVRQIRLTMTGLTQNLTPSDFERVALPALVKLSASEFRLTSLANIDGTFFSCWDAN
ncbi:MAG: dihydrofolate reductase family protein [Micrococcales bacterium]